MTKQCDNCKSLEMQVILKEREVQDTVDAFNQVDLERLRLLYRYMTREIAELMQEKEKLAEYVREMQGNDNNGQSGNKETT